MAGLDEEGNLVCQPLDTLEDVMNWNSTGLGFRENHDTCRHLKVRREVEERRPKVLVCHDMKGGYLDDRFLQGCDNSEAYRFYHWHLIDTFVYFSHHFITIPPTGWVRAAHRNGVQILGTLITEWEDGSKRCKELLSTRENIELIATKLADIAFVFGFDGWLINIENVIEEKSIPDLQYFVERVTHHCHSRLKDAAKVLWYDSVTQAGALDWQNELNDKNQLFFAVCDGIFLNYAITEEKLSCSKRFAETNDRCFDVYVGVDVFGRATPGGGGFNCNQVLELISKYGLSSAIFAQGWVYENHGADQFDCNELKFWKLLKDFLPRRAHTVPLKTSFCQGYGQRRYLDGEVVSEKSWHNLSLQQLQPCYGDSEGLSFVTSDAYNGGGCLKLINSPTAGTSVIRLFKLTVDKREQPLNVKAIWKECQGYSPCGLSFVLLACDADGSSGRAMVLSQENCADNEGHEQIWNQYVNTGPTEMPKNKPSLQFTNTNAVKSKGDVEWKCSDWGVDTDWLFTKQGDCHQSVILYALLVPTSDAVKTSSSQFREALGVQASPTNNSVLIGNLQIQWKQSPQASSPQPSSMVKNMICLAVTANEPMTYRTLSTALLEIEDLKRAAGSENTSDATFPVSSKQFCVFKSHKIVNAAEGGVNQSVCLHVLQWTCINDDDVDYYLVFALNKDDTEQFIGCSCTNSYLTRLDRLRNPSNIIGYVIKPAVSDGSLQGQTFYFPS